MPLPRQPHPKRRVGGSRSSRRRAHKSTWLIAKLNERFDRFAEIAAQARAQQEQDDLTGAYSFTQPAKEKAPGLATEGSIFFREKEA